MVAEPLIARITAGNGLRSGDESFGAVVVATGVSTVGIWSEPCASCVCYPCLRPSNSQKFND